MNQLFGNLTGLPPSVQSSLLRIYRRRVPSHVIATQELIRSLSEASHATSRQVGALVHRSGQVDYVVVGDATRLMLPDMGRLRAARGRFRGLRLVHTHIHGEPLSQDDLTDLVRLRLDMVVALHLDPQGQPRSLSYAYNVPSDRGQKPYRIVGPLHPSRCNDDFAALIQALEHEFSKKLSAAREEKQSERAILVQVIAKSDRAAVRNRETSLRELRELAATAGVTVVDAISQVRDRIDPKFVLGRGRLEDLLVDAVGQEASLLIFGNDLTPTQAANVAARTDIKVIDRTQLILDIFAQRAQSLDGKVQVELAQLKYALPRLGQKDDSLSRLTGGIGGRGPGETKLEIGRRRARERIGRLERRLKKMAAQRRQRRARRKRSEVPVVALVGYTNAGKSTLLNTLTHSTELSEDRLFATLDPRSRRLRFPEDREVILTDTVGFIRDMPRDLFAAFRATFEEVLDASVIVQVVDASDQGFEQHMATTKKMIEEIGAGEIPSVLVFNKVDLLPPGEGARLQREFPQAVLISALERETVRPLLSRLGGMLEEAWNSSIASWNSQSAWVGQETAEEAEEKQAS